MASKTPPRIGDEVWARYHLTRSSTFYRAIVRAVHDDRRTVDLDYLDGARAIGTPLAFIVRNRAEKPDAVYDDDSTSRACSICLDQAQNDGGGDGSMYSCDGCGAPGVHTSCYRVSDKMRDQLDEVDDPWYCQRCRDALAVERARRASSGAPPLVDTEHVAAFLQQAGAAFTCVLCPIVGATAGVYVRLAGGASGPAPAYTHLVCAHFQQCLWLKSDPSGLGGGTVHGWEQQALAYGAGVPSAMLQCALCRETAGAGVMCIVTPHEQHFASTAEGSRPLPAAEARMTADATARYALREAPADLAVDCMLRDDAAMRAALLVRAGASGALRSLLDSQCCWAAHVTCAYAHGLHTAYFADDTESPESAAAKRSYLLCDAHSRKRNGLVAVLRNDKQCTKHDHGPQLVAAAQALRPDIARAFGTPVPQPVAQANVTGVHEVAQRNPRMAWVVRNAGLPVVAAAAAAAEAGAGGEPMSAAAQLVLAAAAPAPAPRLSSAQAAAPAAALAGSPPAATSPSRCSSSGDGTQATRLVSGELSDASSPPPPPPPLPLSSPSNASGSPTLQRQVDDCLFAFLAEEERAAAAATAAAASGDADGGRSGGHVVQQPPASSTPSMAASLAAAALLPSDVASRQLVAEEDEEMAGAGVAAHQQATLGGSRKRQRTEESEEASHEEEGRAPAAAAPSGACGAADATSEAAAAAARASSLPAAAAVAAATARPRAPPRDPLMLPDATRAGDLPQAALVLELYQSSSTAASRFVRDWGLPGVAAEVLADGGGGTPPSPKAAATDRGAVRRFLTSADAARLAACTLQQRHVLLPPPPGGAPPSSAAGGSSLAQAAQSRLTASLTPELRCAAQLVAALRRELHARRPPPAWLLPSGGGGGDGGGCGGGGGGSDTGETVAAVAAQQLLASIAHAVLTLASAQGCVPAHPRPARLLVLGLADALAGVSPAEARALLYGELAAAELAGAAWGVWRWGAADLGPGSGGGA